MADAPPYIVRFRILSIESPALVNGAMYAVSWRRGSAKGTSQPFPCDSGLVNTSTMPEGNAIIHFKLNDSGYKGTGKYQSKVITINIEEVLRGRQSTVGMLEFDVANCLRGPDNTAHVIKEASFRMGGLGARIEVEVILYPQGTPPPASNPDARLVEGGAKRPTTTTELSAAKPRPQVAVAASLSQPAPRSQPINSSSGGNKKKLTREEAMTLLLSVEGMLEQAGASAATQYSGETAEVLDQQIVDLQRRVDEAKIRMNAKRMIQRAALDVASASSVTYPTSKIRALESTPQAKTFVSDVTSYLDAAYQQHLATLRDNGGSDLPTSLPEVNARIESVRQDLARLHREQEEISRLQLRRDVSDEAIRLLSRIQNKEMALAKLAKHKESLTVDGSNAQSTSAWEKESVMVLDEINRLHHERQPLETATNTALSIYSSRIEEWANRRFAPMRDYDRLHKEIQQREQQEKKEQKQKELQKQILDLFGDMESAPQAVPASQPQRSTSPAAVAPPPAGPAVDVFSEMYASVPATSDFGPSVGNRPTTSPRRSPELNPAKSLEPTEYVFTQPPAPVAAPPVKKDPFADLHHDIFATAPPESTTTPPPPTAKPNFDFHFGEERPEVHAPPPQPVVTPAATSRIELKRTYAFGETAEEPSSSQWQSSTTAQKPLASEYDFGHDTPAASAVQISRPVVDFNPQPESTVDSDSLWDTPLAATGRPTVVTAGPPAAEVYSFGPTSDNTTYAPSNMFVSFGDD